MYKFSKIVSRWCQNNPHIAKEYIVDEDGHWVYLKSGLMCSYSGASCVHEYTAECVMKALRNLERN